MLTLPRCSGTVEDPTHTRGSTGGGEIVEPTEVMNESLHYSLDECMLATQIPAVLIILDMYLRKTMDIHSQIVEHGHQKWPSLLVCTSGYSQG